MNRNGLLAGVLVLTILAPAMLWTAYHLSSPPAASVAFDEVEEADSVSANDSEEITADTAETISGHGKAKPKAKSEKEHKPKAEAKPKEDKHKADAKHKPEAKAKHAPPKPKPPHKPKPSSGPALAKGPPKPPKDELPSLNDLVPIARPVEGLTDATLFPVAVPKTFPPASPSSADDVPTGSINGPSSVDPNGADVNGDGAGVVRRLLRREGSEIKDVVGSVTKRGSNIIFAPSDQSAPLILLPGQLLERVEFYQQVQTRLGRDLPWRISGLITEYRGSNYLLITAATLLEQPANAQVEPVK